MADLGISDGVNVDGANIVEETISNQSGDTFLLTDDVAETVNSYADALRNRENVTPVEVTPGSQTDGSYFGRGRRFTDLERNHFYHFNFDNVTPGRPCTAYFTASYFVDSQAVFDKLAELDIPRESVTCLHRRPSRDMQITFVDVETKNKFVSNVALRFQDSSGVINDEDSPLTFLNIYDAPHELCDEALKARLEKYCSVIATRRGRLSRSNCYNGIRHYRVRIKEPLPSYLRFGKFLVRLSHDGQQHTCRRCNRAGHFASECQNVVCFNCDELGHQSRDCGENIRCCICKSEEHLARRCPFSWYKRSPIPASTSTRRVSVSDPSSDGNVAASAGDPHRSSPSSVRDPSSGGDVAAPASDLSYPSARGDDLSDVFPSDHVRDSDLLAAAGDQSSSAQPSSDVASGSVSSPPGALNSQGFLWEQIAFRMSQKGVAPNPPGPPSTADEDSMSYPETGVEPVILPTDFSADLFSSASTDPSVDLPADPPVDLPADPPVDLPADPLSVTPGLPVDPPVAQSAELPSAPQSDTSSADQSSSSPAPPDKSKSRLPVSSRRKPAPMPPALDALSRRPTRPSLPVSGKSSSADSSPAPPGGGDESESEMVTQTSLKRKQETARKKSDPKKGKH